MNNVPGYLYTLLAQHKDLIYSGAGSVLCSLSNGVSAQGEGALLSTDHVDYDEIQNFYNLIKGDGADQNDLQEKIFGGLLEDDVVRAVEALPEDFRTVVILSDLEGLSYEEIAEFIDCPIGTVRSRLHRGRKMLQTTLHDYAQKQGYIKE